MLGDVSIRNLEFPSCDRNNKLFLSILIYYFLFLSFNLFDPKPFSKKKIHQNFAGQAMNNNNKCTSSSSYHSRWIQSSLLRRWCNKNKCFEHTNNNSLVLLNKAAWKAGNMQNSICEVFSFFCFIEVKEIWRRRSNLSPIHFPSFKSWIVSPLSIPESTQWVPHLDHRWHATPISFE